MEVYSDLEYDVRMRSVTQMTANLDTKNQHSQFLTPRKITMTFGYFKILRRYMLVEDERYDVKEIISQPDIVFDVEVSCIGSLLINEENAKRAELPILSRMGLPQNVREKIMRDVGLEVRKLASRATSDGVAVNYVIIGGITVAKWEEVESIEVEAVRGAEMESMEVEDKLIPATKSSIEALERMVFDNLKECTIFMEEIEPGKEAILMSCSHIYHGDCIVQWLHNSHFCPLCRYEMPLEH